MNKYVVELIDGKPVCTAYKSNKSTYTLEGVELIKFLNRIDESLFGRKARKNPIYDKKEAGTTLFYINSLQKKNIRLLNYPELIDPLMELYKEYSEEINKDNKKRVVKGVAATAVLIGGIALASMAKASAKTVDLETTAKIEVEDRQTTAGFIDTELKISVEKDDNKEEKNTKLGIDIHTPLITKTVKDGEVISDEEIDSIVNAPLVQLDVDGVYDRGIANNMKDLIGYIENASAKWGVGDRLLYDIISQESAGGLDNLVQFEFNSWKESPITIHNYLTGKNEVIVFSNNIDKWEDKVTRVISQDEMLDPQTNVEIAAMALQNFGRMYNFNIPLTIQAYNRGPTNVDEMLVKTAEGEGCTVQDIIDNKDSTVWIDYAWKDPNGLTYFEEVAKHLDADQMENGLNDEYTMQHIVDGKIVTEAIQASVNTDRMTR